MEQFIPISIITVNSDSKIIFINVSLIHSIYQLDSNVIVKMTDHKKYTIPNVNLQVFMDRFKQ
jgi:hypothetical protein